MNRDILSCSNVFLRIVTFFFFVRDGPSNTAGVLVCRLIIQQV